MKIMYHATDMKNLASILEKGLLPNNMDGMVYMTETPEDALKFVAFRNYKEILMIKIKIYKKDENKVTETFDHSFQFFKCRAFGYNGTIPVSNLDPYMKYENPFYKSMGDLT